MDEGEDVVEDWMLELLERRLGLVEVRTQERHAVLGRVRYAQGKAELAAKLMQGDWEAG